MSLNTQTIVFTVSLLTNCLMFILLVSSTYDRAVTVSESRVAAIANQPYSEAIKRIPEINSFVKADVKSRDENFSERKDIYITSNVIQCTDDIMSNKKVTQWSLLYWDSVQDGKQYGCKATQILNWALSLRENELQVYSKHEEDGVLLKIFEAIGVKDRFFVEFHVGDGRRCNTRMFREDHGWIGVMFDKSHSNSTIGLHQASIRIDNVVEKFDQFNVPKQFDFLSVSADFSDFWLMREVLLAGYGPRVIVVEVNVAPGPFASFAIPQAAARSYEGRNKTRWFGASVLAFSKLMHAFDYQLLYVEQRIQNAFFIKSSELGNVDVARVAWQMQQFEGLDYEQSQPPDTQNRPFIHICQRLPCESSNDW